MKPGNDQVLPLLSFLSSGPPSYEQKVLSLATMAVSGQNEYDRSRLPILKVERFNAMEIEIKLFATLRDYLPKGSDRFSCRMEIDGETRVEDILSKLKIPDEIPKIILVNGVHGKKAQILKEGDVVSIFPPVAGG